MVTVTLSIVLNRRGTHRGSFHQKCVFRTSKARSVRDSGPRNHASYVGYKARSYWVERALVLAGSRLVVLGAGQYCQFTDRDFSKS